ncbi:hypothetical protein VOLCADRAFT_93682 [Volvox carteri f. nagariensis]|uniref:Secreted protein n=1 Tax=Volvox carteri f. nagariensis TaxID=3068 RepID=D8U2R9_VOLCA|nr:uncharacterized protein VOLCADRAFT_93682 [Volvox carteri f. nagariensis]EFJ45947.1 hypothetical protein VOLCADRAFT_93682 [Volvox carteri f. nagariensis]|eukprot:XP_002953025.1 hypothetical protein VOLCADRAFT_93682 [Volvox carteri f. nagariensis]
MFAFITVSIAQLIASCEGMLSPVQITPVEVCGAQTEDHAATAEPCKHHAGDVDRLRSPHFAMHVAVAICFEGQAQRIYNEYEALEALRYSYFCRGPSIGQGDGLGATVSDSSAEAQHDEDCFRKEAHYLDASSDEYQGPSK